MTVLYPFQQEGVDLIDHFNGRALLADEMGLGKGVQTLFWLKRHPEIERAIVVCPSSIKWNWQREAATHVGIRADVLETTKPPKRGFRHNTRLLIINYDILYAWMPYLLKYKPQLLIPDECHLAKNPRARRTRALTALCNETPNVIPLSGTPLTNRPAELWPTLHMIRPDLYPVFWPFGHRYCGAKRQPWSWEFKGATHLKELHTNLKSQMMIRRTKAEVLKDLPAQTSSVVRLPIERRRDYNEALHDLASWVKKHDPKKLRGILRSEALTRAGYLLRMVAELKMKYALEWADNYLEESEQKLVTFSVHRKTVARVHSHYRKSSVVVDGSIRGNKRQSCFDQFNFDKKTRVFAGNLHAAGTGWSCKSSPTVAFFELGYVPGDHSQAMQRVHGLNRGVVGVGSQAFFLVAYDTVEEDLCRLLLKKQKILDRVLDGKRTKQFDVFSEFLEVIRSKKS